MPRSKRIGIGFCPSRNGSTTNSAGVADWTGYLDDEGDLAAAFAQKRKALEMIAEGHRLLAEVVGPEEAYHLHKNGLDTRAPATRRGHRQRNDFIDYVLYREQWLREHDKLGVRPGDINQFLGAMVEQSKTAHDQKFIPAPIQSVESLRRQMERRRAQVAGD